MNKNFLSNFLSGAPKPNQGHQQSPSNTQTKKDQKRGSQTIQLDEIQKDFHVYLHLPANHYTFMVEADQNIQYKADLLIGAMERVFSCKSPQMPADFLFNIKEISRELKQILKSLYEKQDEVFQLKEDNQSLIQSMLSKEYLIKSIESTYMERFQLIKETSEEESLNTQQDVEQLRSTVNNLQQQLAASQQVQNELVQKLEVFETERQLQLQELKESRDTIEKLKDELDIYRDIRTGSLIINNIYQRLIDPVKIKEPPIYYLFTSRFRNQVVSYLAPQDLLNFMLTSKKLYFLIRNNRTLVNHVVRCKTIALYKQLHEAKVEANYFTEVASSIPEEILQQGIAKFLAFRFQAGSYLSDVFKEIWDFLDGKFDGLAPPKMTQEIMQTQQQNDPLNQYIDMFQKDQVENVDLIGIEDDVQLKRRNTEVPKSNQLQQQQQQQQQQQSQQQQPQSSASNSIFSKLKTFAGNLNTQPQAQSQPPSKPQQSISLEQLSSNLQVELHSLGSICTNALSIPILKQQLKQSRQDMVELTQRSNQIYNQVYQLGQKCVQSSSKISIQEFLKRLQATFARLLANSHYLRLECQQLQHTTNFLAQLVLKQNKKLTHDSAHFEDMLEECKTLRAMNIFMQGRAKQLEERVHLGEENVLSFSQDNIELKQTNKVLLKDLTEQKSLAKDREQKLKLLSQNIKTINQEKQYLQKTIQNINQGFALVRSLLPQSIGRDEEHSPGFYKQE